MVKVTKLNARNIIAPQSKLEISNRFVVIAISISHLLIKTQPAKYVAAETIVPPKKMKI